MKKVQKLIALSAGGENAELASEGVGIEHIDELMIRFSMRLLRDGHRLSFGGSLGNADEPLTQHLIDTAIKWLDDEDARQANPSAPETWPLINYSGWPYYTFIDPETKARQVGICQFDEVPPTNVSFEELESLKEGWKENPTARRRNADSLTLMRKRSAQQATLRIVWGGKIRGASGWMSGILEEVACTLDLGKPLLLLGGFGGCSKLIAKFLSDETESWPSKLNLQTSSDAEREKLLSSNEKQQLWDRFEKTKNDLKEFRTKLHANKPVNGVPNDALFQALTDESPRQVVRLGSEVARSLSVATNTKKK